MTEQHGDSSNTPKLATYNCSDCGVHKWSRMQTSVSACAASGTNKKQIAIVAVAVGQKGYSCSVSSNSFSVLRVLAVLGGKEKKGSQPATLRCDS